MNMWDENEGLLLEAVANYKRRQELEVQQLTEEEVAEAKVESLVDVARGLVKKVPELKVLFTEKTEKALQEKAERAKQALVDAVAEAVDHMNPEKIDAVTFFAAYAKTQDVLMNLLDEKKVESICNLFVNYFLMEAHQNEADVYESFLNTVQALTLRELELLMSLSYCDDELFFLDLYANLKIELMGSWNITEMQLEDMMKNLCKRGFCIEVSAERWGFAGIMYGVTDYVQDLLTYIMKREQK